MASPTLVPYRQENVFMWNLIQLRFLEYMSVEGHCIIYRFTILFSATIKGSAYQRVTQRRVSGPHCKKTVGFAVADELFWRWGPWLSNPSLQRLQSSQVFCPTRQKIDFTKKSGIPGERGNIPGVEGRKRLKARMSYMLRNKFHRGSVKTVSDWEKMVECSLSQKSGRNGTKMIMKSWVKYCNTDKLEKTFLKSLYND